MAEFNSNDSSKVYVEALRIVYFILSLCGLIFTSILLSILAKKIKKGMHSDTILTIISVFVDLLASGGLLFRAIFTQYPYNILIEHYNWCAYDLLLNTHTLAFSGYILSILSAQRMFIIVFNTKLNVWIWIVAAVILYIFCWSQIIYQILNNNIIVAKLELFCVYKANSISSPFRWVLLTSTIGTVLLTVISYITIIVFSCKQCLKQLELNLDKSTVYRECRTIIFKSLLFLISYMMIYSGRIFCWLYEYITDNPRTWTMEYVSIILISTSVVSNCLTILYMNKEVKKELLKLIGQFKSIFHR